MKLITNNYSAGYLCSEANYRSPLPVWNPFPFAWFRISPARALINRRALEIFKYRRLSVQNEGGNYASQ